MTYLAAIQALEMYAGQPYNRLAMKRSHEHRLQALVCITTNFDRFYTSYLSTTLIGLATSH